MASSDESPVLLDYVSTGCSCSPHACAWSPNGLVAFASFRSVSLYTADQGENGVVVGTLNGHGGRVNCVTWLPEQTSTQTHYSDAASTLQLLSGSVDKQLILWTLHVDAAASSVTMAKMEVLSGHTDTVVAVAACRHGDETVLASTGGDRSVRIWQRSADDLPFECVQELVCGRRSYVLDLSFGKLPASQEPVLACASEDTHIYLWARETKATTGLDDAEAAPVTPTTAAAIAESAARSAAEWCCVEQLKGHEDWVRTVHFAECSSDGGGDGDLLLASGGQDSYVRVWRIAVSKAEKVPGPGEVAEIRLRENTFTVSGGCRGDGGGVEYCATLDAVLAGHEHWVYGVCWQPALHCHGNDGGGADAKAAARAVCQPLRLASASMDKTIMVWHYDDVAGVWMDESRMGDIGGNTLGFFGVAFGPCGRRILGNGYQGAFHFWRLDEAATTRHWQPCVTVSGHFGPVQDIAWSVDGCLLSVSKDQTCRLHGEWRRASSSSADDSSAAADATAGAGASRASWHEIARPQIHGYDLQCLAMTSPLQYACGADEKVVRVFSATELFRANLSRIGARPVTVAAGDNLPLGATVPALGLSNKAVYRGHDDDDAERARRKAEEEEEESGGRNYGAADVNRLPAFSAQRMTSPPVEEDLLQNTLWPETQKLYGHSYELYTLASDGHRWLASACKASKPDFATVLLWDMRTWTCAATLRCHNLTITQLAFSSDGDHLLAVSRDRTWSLWQRQQDGESGDPFVRVAATQKHSSVHQRVIWTCSWSPDNRVFATGSRDKKVALWSNDSALLQLKSRQTDSSSSLPAFVDCGSGWGVASTLLEVSDAVTAVEFSPPLSGTASASQDQPRYCLAVGLESGSVLLATWSITKQWTVIHQIASSLCPVETVQRLRWRPLECGQSEERRDHHQLAVASADHSVRILAIPGTLVPS